MKKLTRTLTLLLTVVTLCVSILPLFVYAEDGISPYYLNTNSCNLYWEVPIGATVDVYRENGSGWANIQYGGRTGWMKTAYLSYNDDGGTEPAHDDTVTVNLPRTACEQLLQALSAALGV